jgi:hypothetical protein
MEKVLVMFHQLNKATNVLRKCIILCGSGSMQTNLCGSGVGCCGNIDPNIEYNDKFY